jgi:hypothetical protein
MPPKHGTPARPSQVYSHELPETVNQHCVTTKEQRLWRVVNLDGSIATVLRADDVKSLLLQARAL